MEAVVLRGRAWMASLSAGACVLAVCTAAYAQSANVSKAALAESLFSEARTLMKSGEYAVACEKFAESQRLDPGVGTQLNLGMCNEKLGRVASAWAVFKEAESLARRQGQSEKAAFARKHLETLKPKLSYLTVTVAPEVVVSGFVLKLDDVPVGQALWGMKMPLDPGKHRVEVSAPGYEVWKSNVQIGAVADSKTVSVVKLKKTHAAHPVDPTKPVGEGTKGKDTPAIGASSTNPPGTDDGAGSSSQATWGYVTGGVGLVALGLGGVFGAKAMSTWKQHLDHCDNGLCDKQGGDLGRDAGTYATISDVGFGVGAGLLVLGTTLVLTAPSDPSNRQSALRVRVSPMLGRRSAAVQVGGAW